MKYYILLEHRAVRKTWGGGWKKDLFSVRYVFVFWESGAQIGMVFCCIFCSNEERGNGRHFFEWRCFPLCTRASQSSPCTCAMCIDKFVSVEPLLGLNGTKLDFRENEISFFFFRFVDFVKNVFSKSSQYIFLLKTKLFTR